VQKIGQCPINGHSLTSPAVARVFSGFVGVFRQTSPLAQAQLALVEFHPAVKREVCRCTGLDIDQVCSRGSTEALNILHKMRGKESEADGLAAELAGEINRPR
jgi:hypothetical protein